MLKTINSGAKHSKPRLALHCRVLPPGEFNGMISFSEPLPVSSERFVATPLDLNPCLQTMHGYNQSYKHM